MTRMAVRLWRKFDDLFLPLAKRAYLRKLRRYENRVEALSQRMGLLQIGGQLFETVPALGEMASGGLGAKRSLTAMRQALESSRYINWSTMDEAIDAIASFLKDANFVLDEYDRGRPKSDRLFTPRKGLKGLF